MFLTTVERQLLTSAAHIRPDVHQIIEAQVFAVAVTAAAATATQPVPSACKL
jgi:hypothetical protein